MRSDKKDVGGMWGPAPPPWGPAPLHLFPHSCPAGLCQSTNRLASHTLSFPFALLKVQCSQPQPHTGHTTASGQPSGCGERQGCLGLGRLPALKVLYRVVQPGTPKPLLRSLLAARLQEGDEPNRQSHLQSQREQGRAEYWVLLNSARAECKGK